MYVARTHIHDVQGGLITAGTDGIRVGDEEGMINKEHLERFLKAGAIAKGKADDEGILAAGPESEINTGDHSQDTKEAKEARAKEEAKNEAKFKK